jgi:hypothetical protein
VGSRLPRLGSDRAKRVAWVDVSGKTLCFRGYIDFLKANFYVPFARQKKRYPNSVFMHGSSIHRAHSPYLNVLPDCPPPPPQPLSEPNPCGRE